MNILEIKKLSLALDGKTILEDLDMDFQEGRVHAIMGTNGAGKSTLVNTIMGLGGYQDFDGDILYRGRSIKNLAIDERARLGITLSWQEPARFEGLLVKDYIESSSKSDDPEIVADVLGKVGLDPDIYAGRAVDKTLSGGERKKVELASILAMKPGIAFLDEPDSGIDIESIERIFEVVKMLKNNGTTVVFITHSLAVLEQAEDAILLCDGKVIDRGSAACISRYFHDQCLECDLKKTKIKRSAPYVR